MVIRKVSRRKVGRRKVKRRVNGTFTEIISAKMQSYTVHKFLKLLSYQFSKRYFVGTHTWHYYEFKDKNAYLLFWIMHIPFMHGFTSNNSILISTTKCNQMYKKNGINLHAIHIWSNAENSLQTDAYCENRGLFKRRSNMEVNNRRFSVYQ